MDIGCNRLENAVKPQLDAKPDDKEKSCNRLENTVKPQQVLKHGPRKTCCNRLENAVKPQPKMIWTALAIKL